jgi:hypothetical protein
MDSISQLLLNGLATNQASPSQGGLRVADYPNPYGLRAYPKNGGGYGGEMLPKSTGWLGVFNTPNNGAMTEYSVGDEKGDFPSIVPTLTDSEIASIVLDKNVTKPIYDKAQIFANERRSQNQSPFYDPFLDALASLPK